MSKRLKLARNLLTDEGVMFISIDDNEVTQLKMLCNQIFGEKNTDIMIWRKSGVGRDGKMKNTTTFRKDHEYIIVCYKKENKLNKILETPNFVNSYPNPDKDPRGPYKAGSISRTVEASNPNHKNYYTVTSPSGKKFTRQFDISKEEFMSLCNDIMINEDGKRVSRIYWGKNDDSVPAIKTFINEVRSITPYSILLNKGTTTDGTKELNNILHGDFTAMRAKPTLLIKTLIQLASKEDSTILDFFAGSGTTGQAVMELNTDDNGHRRFILCTNNEVSEKDQKEFIKRHKITYEDFLKIKKIPNDDWNDIMNNKGICSAITYPRLKAIIKGYSYNDKISRNLFFKQLTFNNITKDNDILVNEINDVIEKNKSNFDYIEKKVNDNSILINGVNQKETIMQGLKGTLRYFKTDFVKNEGTRDQLYYDLTEKCVPMLCVKEGTFDVIIKNEQYAIYTDKDKKKYTCVYFDTFGNKYDEFLDKVEELKNEKVLYIFSLGNKIEEPRLENLQNYKIEAIPQRIYNLFKKIVKLSKEA